MSSRPQVPLALLLTLLCCYLAAGRSVRSRPLRLAEKNETKTPPDVYYEMHLLVPETIRYRGYECEEHKVTTRDGYILTLHRVLPRSRAARDRDGDGDQKPVVFLQHGLMDSSFTWVNNLVHQSLAYILVDEGFDVWLGNSRGNKYSRAHTTLNPDTDDAFWDFDYDQHSEVDLPDSIDYVTRFTGQNKVGYVGHSQGGLVGLAGFINDTLAQKIKVFIALAPAARVDHIESEIYLKLAPRATEVELLLRALGSKGEFLPNDNLFTWLGGTVCSNLPIICEEFIDAIAGYDTPDMNTTRLPVYMTHFPAGTSIRNMVHYAQAIEQAKFQHFDYGPIENLRRYHSRDPPPYDLTTMKVPTAVFWGPEDKLADETDVKWIISQLPQVIYEEKIENFAHEDFVLGINANTRVYNTVLKLLR